MARILVTGATGFIGKALCTALIARDNQVCALVRSAPIEPIQEITYHTVDLGDLAAVRAATQEIGVLDATVHLAARIPQGATNPEELLSFADANVRCLTNLLAAFGSSVGHFISISSIDVYGNSPNVPYQES